MGTRQIESGGANRDRTDDLLHAMQALSQLSYGPTREGREFWGTGRAKSNEPRAWAAWLNWEGITGVAFARGYSTGQSW